MLKLYFRQKGKVQKHWFIAMAYLKINYRYSQFDTGEKNNECSEVATIEQT